MTRMAHVLLTNDDGVSAEGLTTLRARLLELGLRVSVVAPDGNRSGMARAISFDRPVGVVAAGGTDRDPVFACTGSPVDCVRVGLLSGLVAPVDLVVSGINHGLNVGDDVTYSGTVGAALEAAILDVPAIAVSQQADDRSFRFNDSGLRISFRLAAEAATLVQTVVTRPPPARTVLNVNLPSADGSPRVVLTRPGRRYFAPDVVKAVGGLGDGQAFYPYGLPSDPAPRYDDGEGTDFAALRVRLHLRQPAGGGAPTRPRRRGSRGSRETFDLAQRSAMTRRASPQHARAVVVGGGIAGTSAAYHLAVEGWTDVLLLEQNALGAGTTWHAAGAVGRLRVTGSLARMNDRSARLYSQIEAETGVPVGYKRVGGLALAQRPERIAQLRRSASMAAHFGVDVQIIARDEVEELWPLAQLDDVIGAAWLPDDGRAEPGQLPRAVGEGARRRGATVCEGVRVLEVLHDGVR